MTNTEDSIVAARDMYCKCLQDSLSPFIIFLFREMFGKMPKSKRTLRNLQMQLREVKTWNGHQVKEVVDDIIKSQSRAYYEDLLTAILVSNAEILSTISVVKNPSKINLKIPKLENYIHECIINVARALYKNAFLFDENVSSLQRQRHNNEFDLLVKDAIQSSIQQILPIQDIIKQYIMGEADAVKIGDKSSKLFLPDDDIPTAREPPLDSSLQDYMRHGDEEEIAPETIEIVEPEELLDEALKQSNDPANFLDENEGEDDVEPESEEEADEQHENIVKGNKDKADKIQMSRFKKDPRNDEKDRIKKAAEDVRAQGFSLVKRSGSGLFVEDENDDKDENENENEDEDLPPLENVSDRPGQSSKSPNTAKEHKPIKTNSNEGGKDSPKKMTKEEKLSRMMLPNVSNPAERAEAKASPPAMSELDDDDLSLYGLSDGNTNWSDDDNEFAYTDDELLTSDDEDENDGEDIDAMINRIRTASKDTDASDIRITPPTEIVESTTMKKLPAAPKSDVSNSIDIEIDLPNSDGEFDGEEDEDKGDGMPFQDVKTIHIEDSRPPPKKARKSRKSRKTKTPVILFPDAASEDECV